MANLKEDNITYHFRYGDSILLSNTKMRKYLHASEEYESEITKNYEVSVCDNGAGSAHCAEDEWII